MTKTKPFNYEAVKAGAGIVVAGYPAELVTEVVLNNEKHLVFKVTPPQSKFGINKEYIATWQLSMLEDPTRNKTVMLVAKKIEHWVGVWYNTLTKKLVASAQSMCSEEDADKWTAAVIKRHTTLVAQKSVLLGTTYE